MKLTARRHDLPGLIHQDTDKETDMKIRDAQLNIVCGYTSPKPETDLPEIAFAGRSNVGKSSLINSLMQRKRLARVGETPGKTRTINYYKVDALIKAPATSPADGSDEPVLITGSPEQERSAAPATEERSEVFHLVDLPGYGYANVSLDEKAKWGRMVERYLQSSENLQAVFLLVDIRHEPNANDRQMYDWIINSGHTPVLIATKADKVKRSKVSGQLKVIREGLGAPKGSTILPFSALSGSGREEIWSQISGLVRS
jgi:GTP-binding protein